VTTPLRLEPDLFAVLRRAFDCATDGIEDSDPPPVPLDVVAALRTKLAEADADALPGLPVVLALSRAEIEALSACFSVGGEGDAAVTDDQYDAISATLGQAARSVV
jgi:hypothetical protein